MTSKDTPDIILFWYDISVFSRRMDYYLQLRNLPYKRVVQPPNMPRPDLERLGINYRRIPLLAIGRDVFCDTRIIIEKLEQLFPDGALGSNDPFERGMEKVLESWVIDAGPFLRSAACIPPSAPILKDPLWMVSIQCRLPYCGRMFPLTSQTVSQFAERWRRDTM